MVITAELVNCALFVLFLQEISKNAVFVEDTTATTDICQGQLGEYIWNKNNLFICQLFIINPQGLSDETSHVEMSQTGIAQHPVKWIQAIEVAVQRGQTGSEGPKHLMCSQREKSRVSLWSSNPKSAGGRYPIELQLYQPAASAKICVSQSVSNFDELYGCFLQNSKLVLHLWDFFIDDLCRRMCASMSLAQINSPSSSACLCLHVYVLGFLLS